MQSESTAESLVQSTAPQSPPPKKKKLCALVEEESMDLSPEVKVANEVESYLGSHNLDIGSDLSPELKITSGQRSISVQISVMATQIIAHLVIMSRQNFEKCMI